MFLVLLGAALLAFDYAIAEVLLDLAPWPGVVVCGTLFLVSVVTFLVGWFRLAKSYLRRPSARTST